MVKGNKFKPGVVARKKVLNANSTADLGPGTTLGSIFASCRTQNLTEANLLQQQQKQRADTYSKQALPTATHGSAQQEQQQRRDAHSTRPFSTLQQDASRQGQKQRGDTHSTQPPAAPLGRGNPINAGAGQGHGVKRKRNISRGTGNAGPGSAVDERAAHPSYATAAHGHAVKRKRAIGGEGKAEPGRAPDGRTNFSHATAAQGQGMKQKMDSRASGKLEAGDKLQMTKQGDAATYPGQESRNKRRKRKRRRVEEQIAREGPQQGKRRVGRPGAESTERPGHQGTHKHALQNLANPPNGDMRTAVMAPTNGAPVNANWAALKLLIGAGKGPRPPPVEEAAEQVSRKPEALSAVEGPTHVLAIDCEMVGVGPDGSRSSLARVCIINNAGSVLLDKFVAQMERVTDYRTFVSGVRPQDLAGAAPLSEVQKEVADLIQNRILVGHSIQNDLKALLLSHPKRMIRDTARFPPLMRATAPGRKPKPRALRHLAHEHLGLDIQGGEHSPVDDARAALYLYHMHRKEWEAHVRAGTLSQLRPPIKGIGGSGRATLEELAAADDMVDL